MLPCSRPIFLPNKAVLGNRDPTLRLRISLIVLPFSFAVSLGAAAAQSYPPPPPGYYPPPAYYPPPGNYPPPQPRSYNNAPVPPSNVGEPYGPSPYAYRGPNGRAVVPYDPDYDEPVEAGPPPDYTGTVNGPRPPSAGPTPDRATVLAGLPPEDQPEQGPVKELPPQFRRQLVDYPTSEPAGTVIIDTRNTYLYLVLGGGKAMRYGIGVGREGFTWSGTERISRMSEWPDWHPPKEMIERQPYLPRFMAGGEGNPLGARALYLGNTLYRIHGTNQPSTIGHFVSSGCIRLTNEDIEDLYSRVNLGSRVVVLPGPAPLSAAAQGH
jgi:lipoprotein-anchoring transpeptidase ErfK/SrfK